MNRETVPPLRRFVRPIARVDGSARALGATVTGSETNAATGTGSGPRTGLLSPFVGVLGGRFPPGADGSTILALTLAPVSLHERVERETRVVSEKRPMPDSGTERFGSLLRGESGGEDAPTDHAAGVLAWQTERVHTRETTVRSGRSGALGRGRARDEPLPLTVNRPVPGRVERPVTRDVRIVRDGSPEADLAFPPASPTGSPRPLDTVRDPSGYTLQEPPRSSGVPTPGRKIDTRGDAPMSLLARGGLARTSTRDVSTSRPEPRAEFPLAVPRGTRPRTNVAEADQPPLVVRPTPSTSALSGDAVDSATTGPARIPGASTTDAVSQPATGAAAADVKPASSTTTVEGPRVVDALFAQRTTVDRLVDRLYVEFERKLRIERERRGRGR